jgi:hypothetical protein
MKAGGKVKQKTDPFASITLVKLPISIFEIDDMCCLLQSIFSKKFDGSVDS